MTFVHIYHTYIHIYIKCLNINVLFFSFAENCCFLQPCSTLSCILVFVSYIFSIAVITRVCCILLFLKINVIVYACMSCLQHYFIFVLFARPLTCLSIRGSAECPAQCGTESTHFSDSRRVGRRAAVPPQEDRPSYKSTTSPAEPISYRHQLMPSDEI